MHKSAEVMFIREEAVHDPEAPQAVREYVTRYFVPTVVFGVAGYIALRTLSLGSGNSPGVAPQHSCDVNYYREGFAEGESLVQWLTNNPMVFKFSKSWDDGCSGHHYD